MKASKIILAVVGASGVIVAAVLSGQAVRDGAATTATKTEVHCVVGETRPCPTPLGEGGWQICTEARVFSACTAFQRPEPAPAKLAPAEPAASAAPSAPQPHRGPAQTPSAAPAQHQSKPPEHVNPAIARCCDELRRSAALLPPDYRKGHLARVQHCDVLARDPSLVDAPIPPLCG